MTEHNPSLVVESRSRLITTKALTSHQYDDMSIFLRGQSADAACRFLVFLVSLLGVATERDTAHNDYDEADW